MLGAGGILFYLAAYAVTNLTAFLVVIALFQRIGSYEIDDYRGLRRRAPVLAILLAFSLLSLMGLPVTAGFFAKLYIFDIAIQSDLAWLAMIGVVNAVYEGLNAAGRFLSWKLPSDAGGCRTSRLQIAAAPPHLARLRRQHALLRRAPLAPHPRPVRAPPPPPHPPRPLPGVRVSDGGVGGV